MIEQCLRCGHDVSSHDSDGCRVCSADYVMCRQFIYSPEAISPPADRFESMWDQQKSFMKLLKEKRNFPDFPVDLSSKSGQKFIKGLMHECMDELHESLQHLKNSKDHRATEITSFDRAEFVEELCDSLHYFIEIAIAAGVSPEELFESYMKKGEINRQRILKGY